MFEMVFSTCGHNSYSDVNQSSALHHKNNNNNLRTLCMPLYMDQLLFLFLLCSISVYRSHVHSFQKMPSLNEESSFMRLVWEEPERKTGRTSILNSNTLSQSPFSLIFGPRYVSSYSAPCIQVAKPPFFSPHAQHGVRRLSCWGILKHLWVSITP